MISKEDREKIKTKAEIHINENLTLLFIVFTIFTFIVTINDKILKEDLILATQLVMALPLFASSLFARATIATSPEKINMDGFGFVCFVVAYSFLVNTVGILLSSFVSQSVSIIFFITNLAMALGYSAIIIKEDKSQLKNRIYKDAFFAIIIVLFGLLHVLQIY